MLKAIKASKRYFRKTGEANFFYAVNPLDLELAKGSFTVISGRSGSGKTTLLHMLSGLLAPSEGTVMLDDIDLYTLSDTESGKLRSRRIAVIPQVNTAVRSVSVMENIVIQSRIANTYNSRIRQRANELTTLLGIENLRDSMPDELSGGEKRRMSIARALVGSAEIILADEPTGDLDNDNTLTVLQLLREAADNGAAVLCVTHEPQADHWADHIFRMHAGTLEAIK